MRFHNAFNFSEVLLTITVIGIVGALTMPGLISSYEKKVYVSQLQKALSQFEQAMQNVMVRHECTDIVCSGLFSGDSNSAEWNNKMDEEMKKSIKVIRSAKSGEAFDSNVKSVYLKPRDAFTTNMDWAATDGYKFITPDGVFYHVKTRNCEPTPKADSAIITNFCADVTIDVNSKNRPNQYGRDLFTFVVGQNGHLYPIGGVEYVIAMEGDEGLNGSNYWVNNMDGCVGDVKNDYKITSAKGTTCAARIMGSGWKMEY